MQRRAMGLLEIATTARAMQLAPQSTAGMTVGRDIAQAEPATIRTGGTGTEMLRGIHLARPSPRGHDAGWGATGRLGCVRVGLLTGGTGGLAGEARKRLWVAGALAQWHDGLGWLVWWSHASAGASGMQDHKQPKGSQDHQLGEKLLWNH